MTSKREEEKKRSLGFLAGIAEKSEAQPWLDRKAASPAPARAPPARPKPRPAPAPAAPLPTDADRKRRRALEERAAKLEEERTLRERRARELAKGANLEWRGMSRAGVPTGIRRTAFDPEPSLAQKIDDVLGKPPEKEGRAKARDKGRRLGGK